jgi:hypothetical protein
MNKIIKFLAEAARLVVGVVFFFSGFVKAVDPLGTTYKIQDYLISFGLLEFFPLALPGAVVMVTAELVLGTFLLLGIYRKWTLLLIGCFMFFFTPLTLWVAINDPVADCGCFGDALVITNWQTFIKNVVLLLCTLFLIFKFERITPFFSKGIAKYVAIFVVLAATLFTFYNLYRLPVLNFRPYRIGANIPEKMHINPENADVFQTILVYSKDGVEQEFTQDDFPWDDPAWTFVEMRSKLVQAGERPAIESFAIDALIFDETTQAWLFDEDITDAILSNPSYSFLMISYSLNRMNTRQLDRFREINRYARENGYSFYLLTASPSNTIGEWENRHQTGFRFIHGDERVLKTMIRSNPGLMLLKNGTIINKWAASEVAPLSRLTTPLGESKFVEIRETKRANRVKLLIIGLLFLVPLGIFRWVD